MAENQQTVADQQVATDQKGNTFQQAPDKIDPSKGMVNLIGNRLGFLTIRDWRPQDYYLITYNDYKLWAASSQKGIRIEGGLVRGGTGFMQLDYSDYQARDYLQDWVEKLARIGELTLRQSPSRAEIDSLIATPMNQLSHFNYDVGCTENVLAFVFSKAREYDPNLVPASEVENPNAKIEFDDDQVEMTEDERQYWLSKFGDKLPRDDS